MNILSKSNAVSTDFLQQSFEKLMNWLMNKAGNVIIAFVFIAIGMKVVNILVKVMNRSLSKTKMEASVMGFVISAIRIVGYILVFITAASIVGVEVTSFVTILGTASMAIGLALQGALSNLAGGMLILILKPFAVGDYIIENEKKMEGTVVSIDIFYTRLLTYDNKMVVIPNGILTNNSLVNVTNEVNRKLEIKIPIAYNTDMQQVKELVHHILQTENRILESEPKDVYIDSFDDSGMTLGIRAWVKTEEYWNVLWKVREELIHEFRSHNVVIPFQRVEVEMMNNK